MAEQCPYCTEAKKTSAALLSHIRYRHPEKAQEYIKKLAEGTTAGQQTTGKKPEKADTTVKTPEKSKIIEPPNPEPESKESQKQEQTTTTSESKKSQTTDTVKSKPLSEKSEETKIETEEEEDSGKYEWRSKDCDATAPGTSYDYMTFIKHAKGHTPQLVDVETGKVVANNLKQAIANGIILPSIEDAAATGNKRLTIGEDGITIPVTFPPIVFTQFDIAKSAGKEDPDIDLDAWLYDCVQKRYELDYKLEFVVQPIPEKDTEKKEAEE